MYKLPFSTSFPTNMKQKYTRRGVFNYASLPFFILAHHFWLKAKILANSANFAMSFFVVKSITPPK